MGEALEEAELVGHGHLGSAPFPRGGDAEHAGGLEVVDEVAGEAAGGGDLGAASTDLGEERVDVGEDVGALQAAQSLGHGSLRCVNRGWCVPRTRTDMASASWPSRRLAPRQSRRCARNRSPWNRTVMSATVMELSSRHPNRHQPISRRRRATTSSSGHEALGSSPSIPHPSCPSRPRTRFHCHYHMQPMGGQRPGRARTRFVVELRPWNSVPIVFSVLVVAVVATFRTEKEGGFADPAGPAT